MEQTRRIALLGGGQLGRMFIENALRYGVEVSVLDPDAGCPCARIADRFVLGHFDDHDTVLRFAADADVVGVEIEHVSTSALEALEALGKTVIPAPAVLQTIQDKGLQKEFYVRHGIPTAPFALINHPDEIMQYANLLPGFLKARKGGYDGKGVMAVDAGTDPAHCISGPCVLEKRIAIAKELAVIAVIGADGTCLAYDPVEMVFDPELNLVDTLLAPARCDADLSENAKKLAMRTAKAFGAPGIYAVEMFLTPGNTLLVNETAPRAHNSGHFTIEACSSSQYDQLLRAYMGWPPGSPAMYGPAAMVNLVGEKGSGKPWLTGIPEVLGRAGTFIHLYGKRETRTGRKMGHVTIVGSSTSEVDQAVAIAKAHCKVLPAPAELPGPTRKSAIQ